MGPSLANYPNIYINYVPGDGEMLLEDLLVFFSGDLNPVAAKAQKKVPVPEGLDLDAWINEPIESDDSESDDNSAEFDTTDVFVKTKSEGTTPKHRTVSAEPSPKEIQRKRAERLLQQQHDPNYLKPKTTPTSTPNHSFAEEEIPVKSVADLGAGVPSLIIPGLASADQYFDLNGKSAVADETGHRKGRTKRGKEKKSKKKKRHREEESDNDMEAAAKEAEIAAVFVNRGAEMPDGTAASDGDDEDEVRKSGEEEESYR